MNAAIGVWVLVLGGVLVPDSGSSVGEPGGPAVGEPFLPPAYQDPGALYPAPGAAVRRPSPPGRSFQGRGQAAFPGAMPASPVSPFDESTQGNRFQDPLIPYAPTNPSAASRQYPWGAPTAGSPLEAPGSGQQPMTRVPSTSYTGPRAAGATAYVRPGAGRPAYQGQSPYSSFASQRAMAPGTAFARQPAYSPQAGLRKPFTGYRRPRAVSPYMQLDRIDSNYDVIDPYSSYVAPQLEQMRENQQMERQIGGLQRSVQTLGRQTQSLRGVIIPQYYMNRSQYYPGFRR